MTDPDISTTEVTVTVLPAGFRQFAAHWGLVLGYGIVTLVLGIVLVAWPDASVTVFTAIIAIQLIIAGVFRVISALAASGRDTGIRVLSGVIGGFSLVVGLLVLRDPLQSVLVLGIVLGVFWLVAGVVDIMLALLAPPPGGRTWELVTGGLTVLVGGFLIVFTEFSLHALVIFTAIWLIVGGALAIIAAIALRSFRPAAR
ncbi:HdeD family acid-resistance protein [Nocardioides sambongensis]|uniref:HdeD family acid-resistance protein n=1 Tax=Nocardioides sambongensis TaxID=2589074 RepID=UPI00112793EF|nr:DUF308 domain-containing protein [Nocardioides sambongensis]